MPSQGTREKLHARGLGIAIAIGHRHPPKGQGVARAVPSFLMRSPDSLHLRFLLTNSPTQPNPRNLASCLAPNPPPSIRKSPAPFDFAPIVRLDSVRVHFQLHAEFLEFPFILG